MARDGLITSVACEVYEIPTDRPEGDGTIAWSATTMVLVTIRAGGSQGLGWTYAGAGCKAVVEDQLTGVLHGGDPVDIPGLWGGMVRACRNLGRPGLVSCALSAVDIALSDLKARLLGVALHPGGPLPRQGARLRQRRLHHLRRHHHPRTAGPLRARARHSPREDQDWRVVGRRGAARPGPGRAGAGGGGRGRRVLRRRQRRLYP